ncbi:NADP-dependent oxidoreductase [Burkholderia sp. Ax-1719]|uniref:quinone oxidoreductase family protein n=1 Tax=Burkholderia sp. Ax-1719 TaxID=2608334 RepID=UPI00142184F6|nr:NADP-dependent oxidoreductase [Burkholderia sp. Ax-1719]NIE66888.1 NADP-dependent oxidoreductase [Burkholderia sp. Ax-1719]
MKAVGLRTFGGPEVLEVLDLPHREPGSQEVEVRVLAATVNPADRNVRTGFYAPPPNHPIYVPGMEVAGIVSCIGRGTMTDLEVGDRVMAIVVPHGTHGGYAESVVLPAASVVRSPRGVTDAEAATIPMNALTAKLALDALGLSKSDTVAVTGAVGAVGGFAVQLAKSAGLRVIADAKPEDERLLRELGADVVVPRGAGFATEVAAFSLNGIDGVVDAGVVGLELAAIVREGGTVATLRGLETTVDRDVRFLPVMSGQHSQDTKLLNFLRKAVEAQALKPRVCACLTAEEAVEAHHRLDAGGLHGRIVLTF